MATPDGYSLSENEVRWLGERVKGADPTTFVALNHIWGRDARSVFCQTRRLRDVDPAKFEVLNALYARAGERIHCLQGVAKKIADPATFRVLDSGVLRGPAVPTSYLEPFEFHVGYAVDAQNVYFHDQMEGVPRVLRKADPATFEVLGWGYARDRKRVYNESFELPKAQPATFVVLGQHHSTDGRRAYYGALPIEDADPQTYVAVGGMCAKDATRVFLRQDVIEGADPVTFQLVAGETLARDAEQIFADGEALPDVDPDQFQPLGGGYFRERTKIYWLGQYLPQAEADSFVVLPVLSPADKRAYWAGTLKVEHPEAIDGYTAIDRRHRYQSGWAGLRPGQS